MSTFELTTPIGLSALENRIHSGDLLEKRFGLKAASFLTESAEDLPAALCERLEAARMQALLKHRAAHANLRFSWRSWIEAMLHPLAFAGSRSSRFFSMQHNAADGEEDWSWWGRIATGLPLVVLVVGLFAISAVQQDNRAKEIAEVDVALLTDTLPPSAFADAGFVQFLKSNR